jgi:hypothetical protein
MRWRPLLIGTVVVLVLILVACGLLWKRHRAGEERLRAIAADDKMPIMQRLYEMVTDAAELSATKPYLLYGTLLGWRRDRRFICWDFDVDFGIDDEEYAALLTALQLDEGYTLRVVDIPFIMKRAILEHAATGINCDIFPHTTDAAGGTVRHTRIPRLWRRLLWNERARHLPASAVYPLQRQPFLGRSAWVPRDPDRLLRAYYGKDFMRPDRSCHGGCKNCLLEPKAKLNAGVV